ncbi:MAG: tetratricopeptide repeat protein [Deltaproteobacteria bacterium]|nr:tetratricopeptide repeat protein [Deltaproteobacteria bacterium]
MRYIFAIVTVLLLFMPSLSFAEAPEPPKNPQWFEGTFTMGDNDTPKDAVTYAENDARRKAVEFAGVYVESYTTVNNFQLRQDEIKTLSEALVRAIDRKEPEWKDRTVTVKIKYAVAVIDRKEDIENMAKRYKRDPQFEAFIKDKKIIENKINEMQDQIEKITDIKDKASFKEEFFDAKDWFYEGYTYSIRGEDNKAIDSYNKALAKNPNFVFAYNNSGVAYFSKGQYNLAIQDYNKAIAINPNLALVYRNRGDAYSANGQYDKAIEDYNKVLTIDPEYARDRHTRESREAAKIWRDRQDRTLKIRIDALQRACNYGDALSCEEFKKHSK